MAHAPRPGERLRPAGGATSIRGRYEALGAERFYREQGAAYRNPHEALLAAALAAAVARWTPDLSAVLDLACGSGEAAIALEALGAAPVTGCDPNTAAAWRARTGRACLEHDFAAVAGGALDGTRWSLVVCSFALHLCEPSRLPLVVQALARCTGELWIATPHKRPELRPEWGFTRCDEFVRERIRVRRHRLPG